MGSVLLLIPLLAGPAPPSQGTLIVLDKAGAAAQLVSLKTGKIEATLPTGAARFFAIRIGDRTQLCFDACEICGDKGYFEDNGALVCRNCTSPIALTTVGRAGGCNPIPISTREVAGASGPLLEIRAAELEAVLPRLGGR